MNIKSMKKSPSKYNAKGRVSLPPETAERKREMSSVALLIEFEDGNKRKFWTNEFSTTFPKWKRGQIFDLCTEFRGWAFFTSPVYSNKVRSAALFDTRTDKTCKQEYKLMQYEGREWHYTNYAQSIL